MMKKVGERWHCLPCDVTNGEAEAERKSGPRYGIGLGLGFREIPMWVRVVLGLLAVSVWTIPRFVRTFAIGRPMFVATEPAETWSAKPAAQWPKLTLANEFEFKGVPKSTSGTGFLIQTRDGQILGATHSLRKALGNEENEPSMTYAELNRLFVSWRMFTVGAPDHAVTFSGFHGTPAAHSDGDIWLLQPTSIDKNALPVTPLKVRRNSLVRGMRLFVVARLADDPSGKEQVFPCMVQDVALAGEMVELVYDKAVVSLGFAGAPVVDVQGHLAAIITGPGEEPRADGAVTWLRAVGVTGLQRLTK